MRTLAEEELAELSHKAAQQQENLKILLLPKDKNDERNVIMEIRAGTGGDEADWHLVIGDVSVSQLSGQAGQTVALNEDTYNKGKELTITGTSGDWTAVTIDGKAGYVYSQYVTTTDPNAGSSTGGSNPGSSTVT